MAERHDQRQLGDRLGPPAARREGQPHSLFSRFTTCRQCTIRGLDALLHVSPSFKIFFSFKEVRRLLVGGPQVVPLGDGSLLSGGVAVSFSDEDSWELECEGSTPLEALRSYFAEEGG